MNEQAITERVVNTLNLEESVAEQLQAIKDMQSQIDSYWKEIEESMITNDVKSIKGDWGTLTIAERLKWDTTDELPAKFYKKVVDSKKLTDTYRLEGKEIKGATHSVTKYLTKRIKGQMIKELLNG